MQAAHLALMLLPLIFNCLICCLQQRRDKSRLPYFFQHCEECRYCGHERCGSSFGYGTAFRKNQQNETQKFLQENNVQIESWGPFAEGRNNLFTNELLSSISRKYDKSVAQVVLRWLIQRGVVAIPKSVRKERMEENFNVFDFELNAEDMECEPASIYMIIKTTIKQ